MFSLMSKVQKIDQKTHIVTQLHSPRILICSHPYTLATKTVLSYGNRYGSKDTRKTLTQHMNYAYIYKQDKCEAEIMAKQHWDWRNEHTSIKE